jgi:hypothetical protein
MIKETIKSIFMQPNAFFKKMPASTSIQPSFTYYAILLLPYMILSIPAMILYIWFQTLGDADVAKSLEVILQLPLAIKLLIIGVGIIVLYLFSLLAIFVNALFSYGWLKLFGIDATYKDIFAMRIYASTPVLVLGWIPFIGGFAGFYTMALEIIALHERFKFSYARAVTAVLLPIAIITVLVIAFFFVAGFLFAMSTL